MSPITPIRQLRLAADLPMNHLALRAGIGLNALRRMETSETFDEIAGVGVGQFYRVAAALGVSVVAVLPDLSRLGGATLQGVSIDSEGVNVGVGVGTRQGGRFVNPTEPRVEGAERRGVSVEHKKETAL